MYPHVDIHNCFSVPVFWFSLDHICLWWYLKLVRCMCVAILNGCVSSCCYSHMVLYPSVDIHTWSCVHLLICIIFMDHHIDVHTRSCTIILQTTIFHYPSVNICTRSYILMLIITLNHVWLCWYSYFVMCHHEVIQFGSCITMFSFIHGHASQC